MSDHGITARNLMAALPIALCGDSSATALAQDTAAELEGRPEEIDLLRIYSRIDELPEELLDILARDFKVDWWDPDYSLDEKRRTLKGSWRVHKTLGTRTAIETALRAIYPMSTAEPWFQYGGEPYHFRILIDLTMEEWAEGKPWRAMELVQYYQSLRDHMDGIRYTMVLPPAKIRIGVNMGQSASIGVPREPDSYDFRGELSIGVNMGQRTSIGVPREPDTYDFRGTLPAGGTISGRVELPVPEDTAPPPATTILRTGGVCTIISHNANLLNEEG